MAATVRFSPIYVTLTYNGFPSFRSGRGMTKDERVERAMEAAGGKVSGSGCGFGGRDINAIFKTARSVLSFKRNIRKERGFKTAKVAAVNNRTCRDITHRELLERARLERALGR